MQNSGNWAGIIAPKDRRVWNGDKQVIIPILSAEYQFNRRRAGAGSSIPGSAGAVFTQLCQMANSQEDALIRFNGSIWGGGDQSGIRDTKNRMLSDLMGEIVKKTNVDWWFDPQSTTTAG